MPSDRTLHSPKPSRLDRDCAIERDWSRAGVEPSLGEVMNDPLVRLVMRRDSLTPDQVWSVVDAARRRLKRASAASG